jgi:ATP-dependent RNA helicase DDX49/DBP8
MEFGKLGLGNWIQNQLNEICIHKPTAVQTACIPEILAGRDCIGVAKTGSGKTLAFALPILQTLSEDPYSVYALILTPTRELAYQINDQLNVVGVAMGLRTSLIVGGNCTIAQSMNLDQRPHIVVGTPGRLADHLERNSTFSLHKVKYLIIDEADRLLEEDNVRMTKDLTKILNSLPKKRQTLLFTATNTPIVGETIAACPNNPFVYESADMNEKKTVGTLDQKYILTPKECKDVYLVYLVLENRELRPKESIMVFVRSCKMAEILHRALKKLGVKVTCLHGRKPQRERVAALNSFKSNHFKVLICTDVASRGLDIPGVQLVLNHNVPNDPKDYVHRVGRTARAGRSGRSITLVDPSQVVLTLAVEELTRVRMEEMQLDDSKIAVMMVQVNTTIRECMIDIGFEDFDEKKKVHERVTLLEKGLDPDKVEAEKHKKLVQRKLEFRKAREKLIKKAKNNFKKFKGYLC